MGWFAAALLGVCIALVLVPRRTVAAPGVALFRCLFPSWRFFEDIEPGPSLSYRVCPPGGQGEPPFRPALHAPARGWGAVLLNAEGNLHLAERSLLERLWDDLADRPDLEPSNLTSYALVVELVRTQVLSPDERAAGGRFAFRLSTADEAAGVFESAPHEV